MAHSIGKVDDKYFIYSPVTNTPISPLISIQDLIVGYQVRMPMDRLERLLAKGTSALEYSSLEDMVKDNRYGRKGKTYFTLSFEEFLAKLEAETHYIENTLGFTGHGRRGMAVSTFGDFPDLDLN
jgi:hypothetical protein